GGKGVPQRDGPGQHTAQLLCVPPPTGPPLRTAMPPPAFRSALPPAPRRAIPAPHLIGVGERLRARLYVACGPVRERVALRAARGHRQERAEAGARSRAHRGRCSRMAAISPPPPPPRAHSQTV